MLFGFFPDAFGDFFFEAATEAASAAMGGTDFFPNGL
jgi:hypothetical protein